MISADNIMQQLRNKLRLAQEPIRAAFLDNIEGTIHSVYCSQPPVIDRDGNILNKVQPQRIPEAIVRSDDGFKLGDGLPDHRQTLGIMEIYGNHPQSLIRAQLYSSEFRNMTISDAIKRARKEIL